MWLFHCFYSYSFECGYFSPSCLGLPGRFGGWDPRAAISHSFTGWSAQNDCSSRRMRLRGEVQALRTLPSSSPPFTLHFHIWSTAVSQSESAAAWMEVLLRVTDVEQTEQQNKWMKAFRVTVTLNAFPGNREVNLSWQCYEVTARFLL